MGKLEFDNLITSLADRNIYIDGEPTLLKFPEKFNFEKYFGKFEIPTENSIKYVFDKEFTNNSNEKPRKLRSINYNIQGLIFEKCKFPSISIDEFNPVKLLVFKNCVIENISISRIDSRILVFDNCTIENDISIYDTNNNNEQKIGVFNSIVKGSIFFNNANINKLKVGGGLSVINKIKIENEGIEEIEIVGVKKIEGFEIITHEPDSRINRKLINKISIVNSPISAISLTNLNKKLEELHFQNLKNPKSLLLSNCKIGQILKIVDSNFSDLIIFKNCHGTQFRIENQNSSSLKIKLTQSSFKDNFELIDASFSSLTIENSTFQGKFEISNKTEKIENGVLNILNSKIPDLLVHNKAFKSIEINGLLNNKELTITKSALNSINIAYEKSKDSIEYDSILTLIGVKIEGQTKINKGSFNSHVFSEIISLGNFVFQECEFSNVFQFSHNCLIKDLIFKKCNIGEISINNSIMRRFELENSNNLFSNKFTMIDSILSNLNLQNRELLKLDYFFLNCIIKNINFSNLNLPKESLFSFSDTKINTIEFKQSNFSGGLYFRNCMPCSNIEIPSLFLGYVNKYHFGLIREAELKQEFEDLFKKEEAFSISILYSSLGNTEFTEFKFDEYEFVFNNSKILNTFIAGSQFPDKIRTNKNVDPKTLEDFNQLVLAYNQLKKVAENNGDIVKSSLMHSRALENQEKVLFKTKGKEYDKFVFWLNGISNNHGENWFGSVRFIVIGTMFLFFFFALFEHKEAVWCKFPQLFFRDYIQFIDPLAKPDIEKLNWKSSILLFFNKIYVGYGIYQLITAFRRHGKK